MTNGEKFKQIFFITQVDDCDLNVYAWLPIHDAIEIPLEWWNAEYNEPTTKSGLVYNLCNSCTNIGCEFQSGIVRTKCAFYMPPHIESDNCGIKAEDCVSRKAVFKIMDDIETAIHDGEGFDYSGWSAEVYMLPSVYPKNEALEQEPRWIPVSDSERLPEANIYDGHGPVWKHEVLITGYLSFDDKKETFVNMAFAEDVRNKCVPNTNVTAWMPLPAPFEPQESESDA